jgi:hypothetical protein
MKAWIGKALFAVGVVHSIAGFLLFHPILGVLFNEGLLNTVAVYGDPERGSVFWFLFAGFALMIIGGLVDRLERLDGYVPALVSWGFTVLTLTGIVLMPVSGFWLLILPASAMLRRSYRYRNAR